MIVDTHAHAFLLDRPLAEHRRYTPPVERPVAEYLAVLARHGIDRGVLVQPSFLGTDNSYVLSALQAHPDRLRGVAVVAPDVADDTLDRYAAGGIVGLRLNVIETLGPWSDGAALRSFAEKAVRHRLHIELHARGDTLRHLLDRLLPIGADVVVDHLGRPESAEDPGFVALLAGASTGRLWVKLSGPYRVPCPDIAGLVVRLLDRFGPDRLVWGSDWPWTQKEEGRSYEGLLNEFGRWVPDPAARAAILGSSASTLFRFAAA